MKKLKLSLANTQATEVLSREQLKKIMGGEEGSLGCPTNRLCGHNYNPQNGQYDKGVYCSYLPPIANLPSSCTCSATLKDGQSCTD